jgi:hypothetical protein
MRESNAVIEIVNDDPSVRQGLQRLIRSAGWKAEAFASAQEFLARPPTEAPSCLMLDLQLPGLSGLDLQNWREVVDKSEVEYSNLPPGDYRFRVTASNNRLWNEQGDVLDFSVAPAYNQTNCFRALCVEFNGSIRNQYLQGPGERGWPFAGRHDWI